eukprot:5195191-Pleurochrysis_carterae.AAC.3
MEVLATFLEKRGWLDALTQTKEFQRWLVQELRDAFAALECHHWNSRLGLHLHLEKRVPTRQLRRIAQAASSDFDSTNNSYTAGLSFVSTLTSPPML